MGPLGRVFSGLIGKKKRILVAGGVGVPPLCFSCRKISAEYLLIGTKSKAELLPKSELKKVRAKVLCATEDGSCGTKGRVTLLLEKILKNRHPGEFFIQTCGPKPYDGGGDHACSKIRDRGGSVLDETMLAGLERASDAW